MKLIFFIIFDKLIGRIATMILLFAFFQTPLRAQNELPMNDSVKQERNTSIERKQSSIDNQRSVIGNDTIGLSEKESNNLIDGDYLEHSPSKAMYYSLVLPGLGQAYNKKYFKIPIVYAAYVGVGYWINYNLENYQTASDNYSEDQNSTNLRYLKAWRRNLELSFITLAATHALQVLDAYVDAHLFYWDVSPELSLRLEPDISPVLIQRYMPAVNYGFSLKMTF